MMSAESPLSGFKVPKGNDVFISSSLENGVWGPGHGNVFYDADKMEFNPDGTIQTIIPSFKGVGYLNNLSDTRINLALKAKTTASSHKKEKVTTEKVETNQNNPKPNGGSEVQASRTFT